MQVRELKESAKVVSNFLAEQGITVPHTTVLEALSRGIGARNWSTLLAQLNRPDVSSSAALASEPAVPAWSAEQGPMSEAQYVASRGCKCPYCGSEDVDVDSKMEADGSEAWQDVECGDCGATWRDGFELVGYYRGEPGNDVATPESLPTSTSADVTGREWILEVMESPSVPLLKLQYPDRAEGDLEDLVLEAKKVLVLTMPEKDNEGTGWIGVVYSSVEAQLFMTVNLGMTQDAYFAELADNPIEMAQRLANAGLYSQSRVYKATQEEAEAAAMGSAKLPVSQNIRPSLVEGLVSDVRNRSRKYSFSYGSDRQARDCVLESADVLGYHPSSLEVSEAVDQLLILRGQPF